MCASSLHLNFANDANHTLWIGNPGSDVIGWLNTKMFDQTHDARNRKAGLHWYWIPTEMGRDDYTEPGQPSDPTKDTRIKGGYYGIIPSPADGSVWGTKLGFPGGIFRVDPGPDPAKTALTEFYEVPGTIRRPPCRVSRRADWTSTATASFGPCLPAAILPALIAASARGPSTDQPQRASNAGRLDALSHARPKL